MEYTLVKPINEAWQENGVWYQDYMVKALDGSTLVKRCCRTATGWNPVNESKVDLTKKISNTTSGVSLKKSTISLDKTLANISIQSGINMCNHKARVLIDLDYSGSMNRLFKSGEVQRVVSRLLPLALRFDDNGELDMWLFHDSFIRLDSMNIGNFENYIQSEVLAKGYHMGGTNYAPVLKDNSDFYFKKRGIFSKVDTETPVFCIFITDGANFDKRATDEIIRELSAKNIFIQFVGIGNAKFDYLEKLDDLSGRECDNTGFIKVADFAHLNDEQLYSLLLSQYPEWLNAKGVKH